MNKHKPVATEILSDTYRQAVTCHSLKRHIQGVNMSKKIVLIIVTALAAIFLSSCSTSASETEGQNNGPMPEDRIETFDDQLAKVAKELPGFGGMFFDDEGHLNVYLTGAGELDSQALESQQLAAQSAFGSVFGEDVLMRSPAFRGLSPDEINLQSIPVGVKVIPGDYDFLQLLGWSRFVDNMLNLPGVIFTDIDEGTNRLKVGVESESVGLQVEQELAKQSVPIEAVIIEVTDPIDFFNEPDHDMQTASLDLLSSEITYSIFRPTVGGISITNNSGATCTLGFNAERNGVRGFITNSHCTNVRGGVENTIFYQPTSAYPRLGVEVHDPSYFSATLFNSCPWFRQCRYSDTAFVRYDQYIGSQLGSIARLNTWGVTGAPYWSTKDINPTSPIYTVIGENAYPFQGEILDKIGRNTGHTYGRVTDTCLKINAGDSKTLLCQAKVDGAGIYRGDSGSPVFRFLGTGNVRLSGIAWGGPKGDPNLTPPLSTAFYFSPMGNIRRSDEMGLITTFR